MAFTEQTTVTLLAPTRCDVQVGKDVRWEAIHSADGETKAQAVRVDDDGYVWRGGVLIGKDAVLRDARRVFEAALVAANDRHFGSARKPPEDEAAKAEYEAALGPRVKLGEEGAK